MQYNRLYSAKYLYSMYKCTYSLQNHPNTFAIYLYLTKTHSDESQTTGISWSEHKLAKAIERGQVFQFKSQTRFQFLKTYLLW